MSTKSKLCLASVVACLAVQSGVAWAELSVRNAWVRGTTPTQKASGAFMSIVSSEAASLISATSPIAGRVELHEMQTDGGMMRMRRVDKIDLPARKVVDLGPSGYHVMLMDLRQRLVEGAAVPVTLIVTTPDGRRSEVSVSVTVAPITAQVAPSHHDHH